jgi:hypothetical protein
MSHGQFPILSDLRSIGVEVGISPGTDLGPVPPGTERFFTMKHRKLSSIAIVATIVVAGQMGPATRLFAQTFANRTVQGLFGPRTMGQPTLDPYRLVATGAPVSFSGQPIGFDRARSTLVSSSSGGWAFGAMSPNAVLPWGTTPLANPGIPIFGSGSTSAAIGLGGGGGIFPMGPNVLPPTPVVQSETGLPAGTQGVLGQNPYALPGQNPYALLGQNAGQVGNQPSPGASAPAGAQTTPGASPQPGQAPAANAAGTLGQPGAAQTAVPGGAAPAADFVPRIPAPWSVGSSSSLIPGGNGVNAALTARLQNAKELQKRSPLSVSMEQDTVVIRGRVATEHDRDLAAAMLRLEPGVGESIRNELVVVESPAPQGGPTR